MCLATVLQDTLSAFREHGLGSEQVEGECRIEGGSGEAGPHSLPELRSPDHLQGLFSDMRAVSLDHPGLLPHLPYCCRAVSTRSGRAWRPRASSGSPGLQLTTQAAGDQGSFASGYLSCCSLVSAVLGTGNGFVQWEVTGNW